MSIMITTTTTTTTTCTSIVTRSPSNSLQIANSSSSIPISTSSPFASFASSSPSANSSGWKEITPEIFTNINTFMRFQKKKPPPPGQQQSRGKWIYESDDDDCEMIGESNAITTKTTNPASATMSDIEVIEIEPEDVSSSKNEISIDISVVDKNDNRTQPNPHTASSSSSSSSFSQTAINEEPIKKSLTDNVSAKKLSTNHSIDQRWGECSAAAGKRDLKKEKEMEELHRQLAIAIAAENSALLDSDNRFDRKLAAAANPRFTYSNSAEDNRYEKCHRESYPLQNSSFLETIRLLVRPTEIPASYGTKTCGKTDHTNHDAAMNSIRQSSFDPNSTTLIYSDTHRRNVPSLAENHSRILRETIILILVHSGFTDASNHAVEALTDILEWYLERFFEHLRTCAETLDMLSDEIDESRNDSDRIEKRESRNHDLRRDEEDRNIRNLDQAMRQTMQHMKVPDICALARYQQQLDRYYDSTRRQDSKYDYLGI